MYNSGTFVGRVTRDAEAMTSSAGNMYLRFSIAVDGRKKTDSATFVKVMLFGKIAEILAEKIKKGAVVFLQGEVKANAWQKDGEVRSEILCMCETIKIVKWPNDGTETQTSKRSTNETTNDDDIPF
jgi:single-strand DNA-binding protein